MISAAFKTSTGTNKRVALITGATSGIGRSTALAMGKIGFDIAAVGRRKDRLDELAANLAEFQVECLPLPVDLTAPDATAEIVGQVGDCWGRLDVVVAAAGHGRGSGNLWSADRTHWADVLQVDLLSVIMLVGEAAPMLVRTNGTVVLIGSVFGIDPAPGYSAYAAAKHGLRGFGRSIRRERDLAGVRVCMINPGITNTEFASVLCSADEPFVFDPSVWPFVPLTAEDVATTVCWVVEQPPHVTIEEITLRSVGDR